MGGAIAPGVIISCEALFQEASKLPRVEIFSRPASVIAKDTISSMNAGIIYGYAGLVDGIVNRMRRESGEDPKIIATGGLATLISEVSETINGVEEYLTLHGLIILLTKTPDNPRRAVKVHEGAHAMIKPSRLRQGDGVGVVSPAGPVDRSDLDADLHFLKSKGYTVHVAPHVYDRRDTWPVATRIASGILKRCSKKEIRGIFCSRGGYGSLRLLDRIDYRLIREHPKILVGYSDITALLAAVHEKTGLITFHGPMVKGFSKLTENARRDLFQIISSPQPARFAPMAGYPLSPGKARGPIKGGNLSLICRLLGTPFMPDLAGCILFMEDRGEAPYRIDRMLTHLALSGSLEKIEGLIVGQFWTAEIRPPSTTS
jgi:muramoyltetrapeptide carboxypeptidase